MKTFILQLFLSFWLAAIGIFAVTALLSPDSIPAPGENFHIAGQATSTRIVNDSLYVLQHGGCKALLPVEGAFLVLHHDGTPLCNEPLSPEEQALVHRARREHRWGANARIGETWVQIRHANSGDGQHWLLMERTRYVHGLGLPPMPPEALPLSIAVTFIFALILTYPVRRLSRAVRTFAAGDMSVRIPVSRNWWSSIGGTDVRNLMIDFNHMADRVSELMEQQKLLVRDISHELRSPLARLRLALEMTREESPQPLPSLDRMEAEADRLNELIGQMLTLSRMESARQLAQTEPVSVDEVVQSLMHDMEFEAAGRGCSIRYDSTHVPMTQGNRELLRRAFENVIRNAIRFTAAGTEVLIEVSAEQCASLFGPAVRILVSDHGPGVPEESLSLIFRSFYRTDSARNNATGGYGVGLSIAERAVILHGGRISARNRPQNDGLQVEILLPVVEVREAIAKGTVNSIE